MFRCDCHILHLIKIVSDKIYTRQYCIWDTSYPGLSIALVSHWCDFRILGFEHNSKISFSGGTDSEKDRKIKENTKKSVGNTYITGKGVLNEQPAFNDR